MASTYIVRPGETISDVVINATGTLANLNQVLDDNGFDDWTPDLVPGQAIIISDAVTLDANALRQLQSYPVCNASLEGIDDQIDAIFEELSGNWILTTGHWDVNALWLPTGTWNFAN